MRGGNEAAMTGRAGARPVRASWWAAVLAVLALFVLAGCGSDDSSPAEPSGPSGVALPDDFPTDQIPLIGGAVLSAGGSADEGWNLTVQGPADTTAALDSAVKTLTDGGFREVQRTTDGGNQVVVVTATKVGKTYTVEVGSVSGAAGGPNSVFYQVSAS
ncbi:hypothetical protein LX13_001143 [Williamsia maris]|uniref:Uncharacterized protein n=2 Tax=Williamsia maris TaxID=72806 RepID=A0ABT1HEP0_9NOCA|nr:hypothetical protein [Williamsia maris]